MRTQEPAKTRAIEWIRGRRSVFSSQQALQAGIHSRTLATLKKEGVVEKLAGGYYAVPETVFSNPDLTTVAVGIPKAVICLISALSFHELTTQIPHRVYIAIPELTRKPSMQYPPLAVHRFSGSAYKEGIEIHTIDDVEVKIYSKEKSLADCFKFRNKIGLDVAVEALKMYRKQKSFDPKKLLHFARICRVEKIMKPYLETVI